MYVQAPVLGGGGDGGKSWDWRLGGGDLRRKTSWIPIVILMKISKSPTLATLCLGKYVCNATLMIFMWFDSEAPGADAESVNCTGARSMT